MHVINLKAENFKRLIAIDITPTGNVVTLTGKNAQGKSSILDAIFAALGGADAVPSEPIRTGAREAKVEVNLGKYIVTRKFRRTEAGEITTSVAVTTPEGASWKSPQKILDEIIGDLAFDPLSFARAKARDQFDALAGFVPTVNFVEVAALNRGDYEKRTDVNKRAKEARAAASIISVPSQPLEEIDEKVLVDKIASATAREGEIATHGRNRQSIVDALRNNVRDIEVTTERINRLKDEIADLEARLDNEQRGKERNEVALAEFPQAPERIDVSAVAAELNQAREHNRRVKDVADATARKQSFERLAASLEQESEQLTERIAQRNAAKDKAIAEAKMPVEGITFGDGEILLNGVPFSQGSSAEQLRTSVAIAAAANPTLRVIHVRDGSLLDADSLEWLAKFAADNNYQVWVEKVDDGSGNPTGILIENGAVKTADAAERAA